jgi:hypothetical protein
LAVDSREIRGLVAPAVQALAFLDGLTKWLGKQDAKGLAALAGAGVAFLGLLGGGIKFLVGRHEQNTKQKKADRERRTAAVGALSVAGRKVLSDLARGGDMGTAASEAEEELRQPLADVHRLGITNFNEIGNRILATAQQGDRKGLAKALADLDAL